MLVNPSEHKKEIQLLESQMKALGFSCTPLQQEQWFGYLLLLDKWNQHMNLTAIRTIPEMITRHIVESVALYPYLWGERLIDVGCGGGVPGIPLAIAFPEKHFCLLDSNQKKQIFVSQVAKRLNLNNVECIHSLVQEYQPIEKFSTILTRAFKATAQMLALTQHLVAPNGKFLAMIGKQPSSLKLGEGFKLEEIIPMSLPNANVERHLAIITKRTEG